MFHRAVRQGRALFCCEWGSRHLHGPNHSAGERFDRDSDRNFRYGRHEVGDRSHQCPIRDDHHCPIHDDGAGGRHDTAGRDGRSRFEQQRRQLDRILLTLAMRQGLAQFDGEWRCHDVHGATPASQRFAGYRHRDFRGRFPGGGLGNRYCSRHHCGHAGSDVHSAGEHHSAVHGDGRQRPEQ